MADDKKKANLPEGFVLLQDRDSDTPQAAADKPAAKHSENTNDQDPAVAGTTKAPAAKTPEAAADASKWYGFTPENLYHNVVHGAGEVLGGLANWHLPRSTADIEKNYIQPAAELAHKAWTAPTLSERLGYGGALALPIVGPMAASLGEQVGRRDVGGALARGGGMWAAGEALGGPREAEEETAAAKKAEGKTLPRTKAGAAGPHSDLEPLPVPRPPVPSADVQLNQIAQRIFRKPYAELSPEEQVVVARSTGGGPPAGTERRMTVGQAPGVLERRSEALPLPTKAPTAGAPAFTIRTDSNGIRWAQTPGVNDVSIPRRLSDPAEIQRYVAEKQELQRQGMQTLPRAGRPAPGPPVAPPAPSQTLPETPAWKGGIKIAGTEQATKPTSVEDAIRATNQTIGDIQEGLRSGRVQGERGQAQAQQRLDEHQRTLEQLRQAPPGTTSLDEILRQATGQPRKPELQPNVPLNEQLQRNKVKPPGGGGEGTPPPFEETDPMKREFADPAVRKFARANGAELLRSGASPEEIQAVHDLKNTEIRQAAINAGIDVGQKHVGSKTALGPAQISRQELIDQMIRQGVKPADIPRLAKAEPGSVPFQKQMPVAKGKTRPAAGLTTLAIDHHELGHLVEAGFQDLQTHGIASHRHQNIARGAGAALFVDLRDFKTQKRFDPAKIAQVGDRVEGLLDMIGMGAAVNEVIDNLPREQNPGLAGDRALAEELFDALGLHVSRWHILWDNVISRAVAKLHAVPGLIDLIREEGPKREENLGVEWRVSKARGEKIIERAKALRDAAEAAKQQQAASGAATASDATIDRGGEATAAVGESPAARAPGTTPRAAEKLKPYSPPRDTYKFSILDEPTPGNLAHRVAAVDAVDLKRAIKQIRDNYPTYRSISLLEHIPAPVEQIPAKISREAVDQFISDKRHVLMDDELEAAGPLKRRNIMIAYRKLAPMMEETVNAIRAGHGFGGWWQRFIDSFHVLGKDTSEIERLGPAHEDALKAFHSAVSGNKAVEQANDIAWGAYRDWLREGRPRDLRSIDAIAKRNNATSGVSKTGTMYLDTGKLYKLVNSPQMRDVNPEPFTEDAFVRSPVYGTSPGSQKIPSMVAGTAGQGNWMRVVFDTHMRDLYGLLNLSDAQYIAASMHIREAGAQVGLRAMEAQEQMWGTVLGLKALMEKGLNPRQAAQEFSKGTLAEVGKDYATVILESIRNKPHIAEAVRDLQEWGVDALAGETIQKLEEIVERGQARLAERARPINRQLLERSARRIQGSLREKLRRRGATSSGE